MADPIPSRDKAMDEWRSAIKMTDMACSGQPKMLHIAGITTNFQCVVQLMGALRFTLNYTVMNTAQGTDDEYRANRPRSMLVLPDESSIEVLSAHIAKLKGNTVTEWELCTAETFVAEFPRVHGKDARAIIVMFDSAGGTFPPSILTAAAMLLRTWKEVSPRMIRNAILVTMSPDDRSPFDDMAICKFFSKRMPVKMLKNYPVARARVEVMVAPETDDATVESAMAWSISKLLYTDVDADKAVTVLVRASQPEACRIAHELRASTCEGIAALRSQHQGQEHPFVSILTAGSLDAAWNSLNKSCRERGTSFRAVIFVDDSVRFLPELPVDFGSIHRIVPRTTRRKVWMRGYGVFAETRTRWTASELNALAGIGLDADPKNPVILMCTTRHDAGKSTEPQEAPLLRGTVEYAKETVFCFAHAFPDSAGPMCRLLSWPRDQNFLIEMFRLLHRHDVIESVQDGKPAKAWTPPDDAFLWRVEGFRVLPNFKRMATYLMSGAAKNLAEARLLLGAEMTRYSRIRETLCAVIALVRIGDGNLIRPLQAGTRSALSQIKPSLAGVGRDLCERGRLWVAMGAYSAATANIKSPAPTIALGDSLAVSAAALGELEAEHRRLLHVLGSGFSGGDWKQAANPESGSFLSPAQQGEVDKVMVQAWFGTLVTRQPSTKKLGEFASWCIVHDDSPGPDEVPQTIQEDPSEPALAAFHTGLVWHPEESRFTPASIAKLPTSVFKKFVRDTILSRGLSKVDLFGKYMTLEEPGHWGSDDIQTDWF